MSPTRRIKAYLFDKLAPLWLEAGWDHVHGGFHELLSARLEPLPVGYRRLTVQCRQIYTHAHAFMLTGDPIYAERALDGYQFLERYFRDDESGGWFFKTDLEGELVDATKDTYAHAFVLFSLAYLVRATRDREVRSSLDHAIDVITTRLVDGRHGGYVEATDSTFRSIVTESPRRQNPHMHLLEASLAVRDLVDMERGSILARPMLSLFDNMFFDPATTTVAEYYQSDWTRHREQGHIVEPGHHFEWSWLLCQVARPEVADLLLDWAMTHGEDSGYGGFYDQVSDSGQPLVTSKRIWPVTECLKAWLARYERTREQQHRREAERILDFLFQHYLTGDGLWIEHLNQDLTPSCTDLPGSTTYHITLALTEALRVL